MAMRAGVQSAVKKTTPISGSRGNLAVELSCGHVLLRTASNVGAIAVCPDCTKLRDAAKPKRAAADADVRDELIAELKKQVDYLRALNNLSPVKLALAKPPPPVVAPAPSVVPAKPPDDVCECPKCKHVGMIAADFGWNLRRGVWHPQTWCRKCRIGALRAGAQKRLDDIRAAKAMA